MFGVLTCLCLAQVLTTAYTGTTLRGVTRQLTLAQTWKYEVLQSTTPQSLQTHIPINYTAKHITSFLLERNNTPSTHDPKCALLSKSRKGNEVRWYLCHCMPKITDLCPDEEQKNKTEARKKKLREERRNKWIRVDLTDAVVVITVYSIMWIIGVGGNILVILTIAMFLNKKSVTNIFLASLASADLMLLLVCLPVKAAEYIYEGWLLGDAACKIVYYARDVSFACSIITLTAMCSERYLAICDPMKAHYVSTPTRARRIVVLGWILSFILVIPTCLIMATRQNDGGHDELTCGVSSSLKGDKIQYLLAYAYYLVTIMFAVPFMFMTYAYGRTCYELWVSTKNAERMTATGRHPAVSIHVHSRWNARSVKTVSRKADDLAKKKKVPTATLR